MDVAELFLTCAATAADAIDDRRVADAWTDPSALEGYDVAGLAGHLARAVLTVGSYLERPVDGGTRRTDASGYLAAVLGDADPVDSDLHRTVRARGSATAADGPAALAAEVRAAAVAIAAKLGDGRATSRDVQVLDGLTLPLGEYLRTRLVELVVHLDDLTVSVDAPPAPVPEDAYRVAAGVLAETAARRAGGLPTIRSLARRERHPEPVRAL